MYKVKYKLLCSITVYDNICMLNLETVRIIKLFLMLKSNFDELLKKNLITSMNSAVASQSLN